MIFGARCVSFRRKGAGPACPNCELRADLSGPNDGRAQCSRRTVVRFGTLFSIPLVPIERVTRHLECRQCGAVYNLDLSPSCGGPPNLGVCTSLARTLVRVLVHLARSEGELGDKELERVAWVFHRFTGQRLAVDALEREISEFEVDSEFALRQLADQAATLNARARELVMTAALEVACGDGVITETEEQLLRRIADTLQMPYGLLEDVLGRFRRSAMSEAMLSLSREFELPGSASYSASYAGVETHVG